ncbi:MAG: glutathione S-transferase N-terminal domain-containing protein [Gammaproteobacteria bacterium]|nr:glutathione S-transferase N-terminal domain-containing protein [Gammaproteobacteria bacterium]MCP5136105.1 glutathione S-transferase N-terminal domain-containing protein [Gammaproteobacteria bacterium]
MATTPSRRSVMTLFTSPECPYSHRVRMVLAEKDIAHEVELVDLDNLPEEVVQLNPYREVPVLQDRELTLYDSQVIMDYLDERFPHPPLMPVDPVSRAMTRLLISRIQRDWYSLVADIESSDDKVANLARKAMRASLLENAEAFGEKPYYLSDEMSLVDCIIAPLLWRLPKWGVKLPSSAAPIAEYATRIFNTKAFRRSLTEAERELR